MKIKKFILLFTIVCICANFTICTYAKINTEYGGDTSTIDITEATIKNNLVIDYIGAFIFTIGNIIQDVVSWLIGAVTGNSEFPWADLVVFNTIPILDVNFLNPDSGSILSLDSSLGIGEFIRNIYFSMLSIAIGFLGIAVAVMAVRMALSSIATQKAKYKESIVTWLTSIVLLFGMHYCLAFLFYLNEELVVVASNILLNSVGDKMEAISDRISNANMETKKDVVLNFISSVGENYLGEEATSVLAENYEIAYYLINDPDYSEILSYVDGSSESSITKGFETNGVSGAVTAIATKIGQGADKVRYVLESGASFWLTGSNDNVEDTLAVKQAKLLAMSVSIIKTAIFYYENLNDEALMESTYEEYLSRYNYGDYDRTDLIYRAVDHLFGVFAEYMDEQEHLDRGEEYDGSAYDDSEWWSEWQEYSSNFILGDEAFKEKEIAYMKEKGYEVPDFDSYTIEELCEDIGQAYVETSAAVWDKDVDLYKSTYESLKAELGEDNVVTITYKYAYQGVTTGSMSANTGDNVIASLGEYFKETAWTTDTEDGGWAPTQISIIAVILYVIFVMQSTGFFLQYLKRVFLVVALAVIGPLVVIYDFIFKAAFGTKKNTFGTWIKELSSLIFVQTFHAFLLAIILAIIVNVISTASTDGSIEATGILCIFALLSLNRLELLVKQIFGLTSQINTGNGVRGTITGAALTLRAARRLTDNAGKILGGTAKYASGHIDLYKANKNLKNYNQGQKALAEGEDTTNESLDTGTDVKPLKALNGAATGEKDKKLSGPSLRRGITANEFKQMMQEMREQEKTEAAQAEEAKRAAEEKSALESRLKGAVDSSKAKISAGKTSIASGVMETVGAAHGAIAGAVIGAPAGAGVSTAIKGAGLGDALGEGTVKAIDNLSKNLNGSLEKEIKSLEDAVNKLNSNVASASRSKSSPSKVVEKTTTIREKSAPKNSVKPARSTSSEIDNS